MLKDIFILLLEFTWSKDNEKKVGHEFHNKWAVKAHNHNCWKLNLLYLDRGLENVEWTILIADSPGCVSNKLSIWADPMCRRFRIPDGFTAQADLLTLHHKHLGCVTSYHRWLANKLLLLEDRRPKQYKLPYFTMNTTDYSLWKALPLGLFTSQTSCSKNTVQ